MNILDKLRTAFREPRLLGPFAAGLLLLAVLLLFIGGCERAPTVTGTIKVDGEPLARGSINFVPVDDKGAIAETAGPAAPAFRKEPTLSRKV
jgi:hypothetical protein